MSVAVEEKEGGRRGPPPLSSIRPRVVAVRVRPSVRPSVYERSTSERTNELR